MKSLPWDLAILPRYFLDCLDELEAPMAGSEYGNAFGMSSHSSEMRDFPL